MHVTNDLTWFANSRKFEGDLIDDQGKKIAVKRVGQVYLQLECGLFILLKDVLFCPDAEHNTVSRDLIAEDVTLAQRGSEFALIIHQPNDRIVQIEFSKKIDQMSVILTKQPSFEVLFEQAITHPESSSDQFEIINPLDAPSTSNMPDQPNQKSSKKQHHRRARKARKSESLDKRPEAKPIDVVKRARLLMNKLTPTNLETIVQNFQELELSSVEKLKEVVEVTFQSAISHPIYAAECAFLISKVGGIAVQDAPDQPATKFNRLILNACQSFFETQLDELKAFDRRRDEIHKLDDDVKKRQLLDELDYELLLFKKKGLGNVNLISALFLHDLLKSEIVYLCMDSLLEAGDDVSLEYLCALLKLVGKQLEEASPKDKEKIDSKMASLNEIITEGKVRPRTKFLIMDVLECRANDWKLRQIEEERKPFKITRLIDQVWFGIL